MKKLLLVLSLLLVIPALANDELPRLAGTVTKVVDGDTIDVKLSSGPIRVRLTSIDTPEKGQPWGKEAAAALSRLVLNHDVEIEPFGQDRYDRMIGRVYIGNTDINGELVKQGHAWAFRKYVKKDDASYCAYEDDARKARRGLWAKPSGDWLPPWLWREFKRMKVPEPYVNVERFSEETCLSQIGKKLGPLVPAPVRTQ